MKKYFLSVTTLLFVSFFSIAQYNTDNLKLITDESAALRFTYEQLRIYPIKANDVFHQAHKDIGTFGNLQEAIESNKVAITEVDESGTVNTLYAENKSTDSIFVMAGEVVKGGKQDRVLAQDFIIAPGEKINVSAFCVEQGRWNSDDSNSGDYMGVAGFLGYSHVSSNSIRKEVVKGKNQSNVWEKVGEITENNDAESSTGSYTELENSPSYQNNLSAYLEKFESAFEGDKDVIGVVAVTGDEIIGCDLFATHDLFRNAFNNLLHAYATEAITNGEKVKITDQKVQEYLNEFLADESKQEKVLEEKGSYFMHRGNKFHMSTF